MTSYDMAIKHGAFIHSLIRKFDRRRDELFEFISCTTATLEIFEILYNILSTREEINRIEDLDVKNKNEIWQLASSLTANKKTAIRLSKAIYLTQTIGND